MKFTQKKKREENGNGWVVWTLFRPNLHFRTFLSDRWALISSGRASAVTSCFVYLLRLLTRPQQQDQKLPPTPAATDPPRHPTPSINSPPPLPRPPGDHRRRQPEQRRGEGNPSKQPAWNRIGYEEEEEGDGFRAAQGAGEAGAGAAGARAARQGQGRPRAPRQGRGRAPPRRARGVPPRAPPRRRPRAGRGNNTTTKAHNNHVPNLLGNLGLGSLLLPPSVIHFAVVCIGFYPV